MPYSLSLFKKKKKRFFVAMSTFFYSFLSLSEGPLLESRKPKKISLGSFQKKKKFLTKNISYVFFPYNGLSQNVER
jgi:hypothetical protein